MIAIIIRNEINYTESTDFIGVATDYRMAIRLVKQYADRFARTGDWEEEIIGCRFYFNKIEIDVLEYEAEVISSDQMLDMIKRLVEDEESDDIWAEAYDVK